MPGTILSVNIAVGDSVKRGQVLMILEAMKMEMRSCAPGTPRDRHPDLQGRRVESGTPLCTIQ